MSWNQSLTDVVMSIKPVFAEMILEGRKTVELRRRFPIAAAGALAWIYVTSPVKEMVASVELREILRLPVDEIRAEFGIRACIGHDGFDRYFEGLGYGFALILGGVRVLGRPVPLNELRGKFDFHPPQSFCYAKHGLSQFLRSELGDRMIPS